MHFTQYQLKKCLIAGDFQVKLNSPHTNNATPQAELRQRRAGSCFGVAISAVSEPHAGFGRLPLCVGALMCTVNRAAAAASDALLVWLRVGGFGSALRLCLK